jgi:hypothetical protein
VVDDRALVVRPQQDQRAVQLEQVGVVDAVHPAVRLSVEPDHAP